MSEFQPDKTMLRHYLQNKLSPDDETQLELWLADHPEALADLELDLLMQVGVGTSENHEFNVEPQVNIMSKFLNGIAYVLAAIFMSQLIFGKYFVNDSLTFIDLDNMRGAENIMSYQINPDQDLILRFGVLTDDIYQMTVNNPEKNKSFQFFNLRPNERLDIIVKLSSNQVETGLWEVSVTGNTNTRQIIYELEIRSE
ncbi:hypothetical protein [Marinicella meishanensis]|uniref:hypothetical protein n=1 Tax=Marinicella meishanensis TaxID=2873263 RepID=UPI001CBCE2B6|nr:hypothetical protein [Marinicella sp. NBU2979]